MKNKLKEITDQIDLNTLVHSLPGSVFWKDINGVYLGCNDEMARMLELRKMEILGKTDYELAKKTKLKKVVLDAFTKVDREVIESGIPRLNIEEPPFSIADGIVIRQLTNKVPLKNESGEVIGVLGISLDISHLKELENQLTIAKEQAEQQAENAFLNLEQIVASMPGSVYWKDRNGIYQGGNELLAKIVGLNSISEVIGKSDYDFEKELGWDAGTADALRAVDMQVMETGIPILNHEEVTFRAADGKIANQLTNKVPLRDKNDNVVGVVGISTDITQLKETQKALAEQIKKTEQVTRSKGEFIAKASHEIRNPVGGVSSLLSMIKERLDALRELFYEKICPELKNKKDLLEEFNSIILEVTENYHDAIEKAEKSLKALKNLEELHFLEMTGASVNWVTNRVSDLIDEAIANTPYPNIKDIDIRTELKADIPDEVEMDFNNARDALSIIIGNAIRFSENKGIVKINVSCLDESNQFYLKISIQDFGKGITEEQVRDLFHNELKEEYQIEDRLKKPSVQLKRAKIMLEASGGVLTIDSILKIGTTVIVKIPYRQAQSYQQKSSQKLKSLEDLINLVPNNILLVEDDDYNQKIIKKYLLELGCKQITVASTGKEAIKFATENDFNIIFQDFTLPDINGLEVGRQIAKAKGEDLVIIGVTSHTSEDTEAYSLEQGVMEVIFKPITKEKLKRVLEAALKIIYTNNSK